MAGPIRAAGQGMTTRIALALQMVVIALAACSAAPSEQPVSTATGPSEKPAAATATRWTAKTSTPAPKVPTMAPPTPTGMPPTDCQGIIDAQLPKDLLAEGVIIFQGECEGQQGLFRLSSGTRKIEPFLSTLARTDRWGDVIDFYEISRDRRWLAFEPSRHSRGEEFLITTGADENSVHIYPETESWWDLEGWFGDGLVGIRTWTAPERTVALVDSEGGIISQIHFPYVWKDEGNAVLIFDPTLKRVLYLDDTKSPNAYVLKDVATRRELWRSTQDQSFAGVQCPPEWSPEASRVALATLDREGVYWLQVITRDGVPISNARRYYLEGQEAPWCSFQWSPSGKYLVFWTKTEQGEWNLVLWEPTRDGLLTVLRSQFQGGSPQFSPDEKQFIVRVSIGAGTDSEGEGALHLVDFGSGDSVQLDLELAPFAWLRETGTGIEASAPHRTTTPQPPALGSTARQTCLEVREEVDSAGRFDGGIIFTQKGQGYVATAQEGIRRFLDVKLEGEVVSPDRKWLVFEAYDDEWNSTGWWQTDLDGTQTGQITLPGPSWGIKGWADDGSFWIACGDCGVDLSMLDPSSGTLYDLQEYWPGRGCTIDSYCHAVYSWPMGMISPKNDFERLIYLAATPGSTPRLTLENQSGEVLWEYSHWLLALNPPQWSPDQETLAIPLPLDKDGDHYELLVVDRDGKATQLSDFAHDYPAAVISDIQWSPDGTKIAFWMDTHTGLHQAQRNRYRLFVLDVTTRQVTDYCVEGNYQYNEPPTWSPDGQQVAINRTYDGRSEIILVDLEENSATLLTEGELVGWMVMP